MTPTETSSTTNAFGTHSVNSPPAGSVLSQSAASPLGVLRTSSAAPAHTNDIASVTTMSGTRVMTTRPPLMTPSTTPSARVAATATMPNSSLAPVMSTAAVTFVSAIIEPIDRSMPPAMTTTAWATAAKATGSAARASESSPAAP